VAADTKHRILESTSELFRRHGYAGTGLKQIVAAADAPFGSIYHHFPGGKQQLCEEVILSAGRMYFDLVHAIFAAAPDPVSGTRNAFLGAAAVLEATDYVDACPIETVALEVASSDDLLRRACAEVFEEWIVGAGAIFREAGVPEAEARVLAISLINALEGAFVLARTLRSPEPLEAAAATMTNAVTAALPGA